MLLAVIPAALAGSAILAFFWTLVMRINELEGRTVSTQTNQAAMQELVQQEMRGADAVRTALGRRMAVVEEGRQADADRMGELTARLEESSSRQSQTMESMATMLTTMHAQMMEQEERLSALVDLRLTRAAQETSDDLRRLEIALQSSNVEAPAAHSATA